MAVHKRGYQRYRGPYSSHRDRFLAYPRMAWRQLFEKRLVVIALVVACFWPLACAVFIYISNQAELLAGFGGPAAMSLFRIDGNFFAVFMDIQGATAMILAALAGPGLIAPDLANGGLTLYFSRPLSRLDYLLARLLVLAGLLSSITWIPGVLLFSMQTGMAGSGWFLENWALGLSILAGFTIWILLVSLVALASSAYVRWRILAGALVLGFFFVLAGASEMVNQILRVEWAALFNPARSMDRISRGLMGVEALPGPGPWESVLALMAIMALLCVVLERKLRPVEVVV